MTQQFFLEPVTVPIDLLFCSVFTGNDPFLLFIFCHKSLKVLTHVMRNFHLISSFLFHMDLMQTEWLIICLLLFSPTVYPLASEHICHWHEKTKCTKFLKDVQHFDRSGMAEFYRTYVKIGSNDSHANKCGLKSTETIKLNFKLQIKVSTVHLFHGFIRLIAHFTIVLHHLEMIANLQNCSDHKISVYTNYIFECPMNNFAFIFDQTSSNSRKGWLIISCHYSCYVWEYQL